MSQSIANFFKPKNAAGDSNAQIPEKKMKNASSTSDSAQAEVMHDAGTKCPPKKSAVEKKKDATSTKSPTKKSEEVTPATARKRVRQAESDGSDTDADDGSKGNRRQVESKEASDCVRAAKPEEGQAADKLTRHHESHVSEENPASSLQKSDQPKELSCVKSSKPDKKTQTKNTSKLGTGDESAKSGNAKGKSIEREDEEDMNSDENDDDEDAAAHETVLRTALDFDIKKESSWKANEPVPYSHLATAFEKIEATSKRLEITAILTKALRCIIELTPGDLLSTIYLCVNKLAPAHEGVELGLGDMVLTKALAEATGRQEKDIKAEYEKVRTNLSGFLFLFRYTFTLML